jgi:hypothetical protein
VFFGGAAGGGKSDLALGAAIEDHERAIIFRKHYGDLRWLEERSKQIVGRTGSYNAGSHIWRYPENAAKMTQFAALQHDRDWEKHQGNPFDLIVFDEVTQFSKVVYETMGAWNRSTTGQRCRRINTFNPPTSRHGQWVLDYLRPWIDPRHPNPALPGELRWYATLNGEVTEVPSGDPIVLPDGEIIEPRSRTFIPAKLDDNAYLRDTDYRRALQALPEPLRSQMLKGDMLAGLKDSEWQLIPKAWVDAAVRRWYECGGRPQLEDGTDAPQEAMGVDVARGGDDATTLCLMYGDGWVAPFVKVPGARTPTGDDVVELMEAHWQDGAPIAIDVVGVGASPYDLARRKGIRIYKVNNGEGTRAMAKGGLFGFSNVRAEIFWRLRECLEPGSATPIALPDDRELIDELLAHEYEVIGGRIKIKSKDDVKAKLGRSPDKADALTYCVRARARRSV